MVEEEMSQKYDPPIVAELGTVEELTQQFDKIGDKADFLTPQHGLDGSIVPDRP